MPIPEPISGYFKALSRDIAFLHFRWKTYRGLFAHSPKRTMLLNHSASAFFGHLQTVLVDDVVLGLCRLTDPPESMGHKNLSLRTLIEAVSSRHEDGLSARMQNLWKDLDQKVKPFRDRRNKRLAHADFEHVVSLDSDVVEESMGFSRADVEAVLVSVRGIMNTIQRHFTGGTTGYEFVDGWSDRLVNTLKKASFLDELIEKGDVQRRDFLNGKYGDA